MYYSFAEGAVVAYFVVPPHNFITGKKGDREKTVMIGCVPVEIRIKYFPNPGDKNNHLSQRARYIKSCLHPYLNTGLFVLCYINRRAGIAQSV
jgi:hypothetical protein